MTTAPEPGAARLSSFGGWRSPLVRVVFQRLAQALPTLLGVSFMTFSLVTLLPGSAAIALLPENATRQQIADLRQQLGLDRPFLVQYADWLQDAVTGNFEPSLVSGQSITSIVGQRLPVSVELIVLAFLFALGAAVPVAVIAAHRPGGIIDRLSIVIGMVGLSVPVFVLGLVLVLVFAVQMRLLPAQGYVPLSGGLMGNLEAMTLPALTLASPLFCRYTRILRADLVDQMNSGDYILTARAKGLGSWLILTKHALRNSVFPTLTLVGLNLGTLIGESVVIEKIFSLPGIGQELVTAIQTRDIQLVTAIVVALAVAVVIANLVTDLLIAFLDPRIRHGRAYG